MFSKVLAPALVKPFSKLFSKKIISSTADVAISYIGFVFF